MQSFLRKLCRKIQLKNLLNCKESFHVSWRYLGAIFDGVLVSVADEDGHTRKFSEAIAAFGAAEMVQR